MRLKFQSLDGRFYTVNPQKYKIVWAGKSASQFEWNCKKFFYKLLKNHFVCEEFPVKPYCFGTPLRCDMVDITTKIAYEFNGVWHTQYNPHFFKTEKSWWDAMDRDVDKKNTLLKNDFKIVEIYPHNLPLSLTWLNKTYPLIDWSTIHSK